MSDKEDDNKGGKEKEDAKTNKIVKVYETRHSKAAAVADDDSLISEQPETQPENVVNTKKNKRSYKVSKQGDKNCHEQQKLRTKDVKKDDKPIIFVVVKTAKCNKVFHGMDKASKYIKAYPGCQVSIHMDKQSAIDD